MDELYLTALREVSDESSLERDISFKASNSLPDVTISNCKLPSDDPAGGIHAKTDSMIPSPAQLGIDLGTVTFESGLLSEFNSGLGTIMEPSSPLSCSRARRHRRRPSPARTRAATWCSGRKPT